MEHVSVMGLPNGEKEKEGEEGEELTFRVCPSFVLPSCPRIRLYLRGGGP